MNSKSTRALDPSFSVGFQERTWGCHYSLSNPVPFGNQSSSLGGRKQSDMEYEGEGGC